MGRLFGKFIAGAHAQETPSGTVNGTNTAFTLSATPAGASTLVVFLDGVPQLQTEYSLSGATVTFSTAPVSGQSVYAFYVK